jgi:hypothetical protein
MESTEPIRLSASELRPGDRFTRNAAAGTIIEVREATREERDINRLGHDPGDMPLLAIVYRDPGAPNVDKVMIKDPDTRFRHVYRDQPED